MRVNNSRLGTDAGEGDVGLAIRSGQHVQRRLSPDNFPGPNFALSSCAAVEISPDMCDNFLPLRVACRIGIEAGQPRGRWPNHRRTLFDELGELAQ